MHPEERQGSDSQAWQVDIGRRGCLLLQSAGSLHLQYDALPFGKQVSEVKLGGHCQMIPHLLRILSKDESTAC